MVRRDFVKTSCTLCIAVATGMIGSALSSCSSVAIYKTRVTDKKILVPLSLFLEKDIQLIRTKEMEYDIALRKQSDSEFVALLMSCTHANNQTTVSGDGFTCTLHGSRYDKSGQVTKGPAQLPLKKYVTEIISDQIIIHV